MQSTAEAGIIIDNKTEKPQRPGNRFGDAVRQWQLGRQCEKIYKLREQPIKSEEDSLSGQEKADSLLEKAKSLAADSDDSWRKLLFVVNKLIGQNSNAALSKTALEFIEKNISQVERGVARYHHDNDKQRDFGTKSFRSLELLLKLGTGEQITKAADVFKKFEGTFAQEIERQTDPQVTPALISYLLYLTGKDIQDSAFFPDAKKYLEEIIYRLPSGRSATVLRGVEAYDPALIRSYAERVVTRVVQDEKVSKDMVRSWQVLSEDKKTWRTDPEIVAYNKARMKDLEQWKPGSTRSLYDQSGITWFLRYPVQALKDQVNNFDDVTKPYGIVVSAYHEHNRAFGSPEFTEVFSQYYDELTKLGYNVRILEARSRVTLTRKFSRLKTAYSAGRKCQFLIVNAHGSERGIRLGDDGDMQIGIDDLSSETSDFLGEMYQDGMPVVFNSCHSFAIAKALADRLNVVAHGSPVIGNLKDLNVRQDQGGLSLVPKYRDANAKEVAAATYSNDPKGADVNFS